MLTMAGRSLSCIALVSESQVSLSKQGARLSNKMDTYSATESTTERVQMAQDKQAEVYCVWSGM